MATTTKEEAKTEKKEEAKTEKKDEAKTEKKDEAKTEKKKESADADKASSKSIQERITALQKAYWMELESVANYLADSVNLDGVRAEEVKRSLAEDVQEELGHARRLAERIKQLHGYVLGAEELPFSHSHLTSDRPTTDVEHVIRQVIEDEEAAISHYQSIIRDTEGSDYVTQELCISLMADEEKHLSQFEGFLKEYF